MSTTTLATATLADLNESLTRASCSREQHAPIFTDEQIKHAFELANSPLDMELDALQLELFARDESVKFLHDTHAEESNRAIKDGFDDPKVFLDLTAETAMRVFRAGYLLAMTENAVPESPAKPVAAPHVWKDLTGQRGMIHAAGAHLFAGKLIGWFNHERGLPFVAMESSGDNVLSYWHEPASFAAAATTQEQLNWGRRAAAAYFIYLQRTEPYDKNAMVLLANIVADMPSPLTPAANEFLAHLEHLHWLHSTEVSARQIVDDVEAVIEDLSA